MKIILILIGVIVVLLIALILLGKSNSKKKKKIEILENQQREVLNAEKRKKDKKTDIHSGDSVDNFNNSVDVLQEYAGRKRS